MTAETIRTPVSAWRPGFGWKHVRFGWYLTGALFAFLLFSSASWVGTMATDTFAYWSADPPLYDVPLGTLGAYAYSPAFYQIVAPFQGLDWTAFAWLWMALNLGTAIWLGPVALAFPGTAIELYHGNIHLLMAAAIVLGFRHPWTWAFILLTKVTPGIGMLWFAVRREWRSLAIALGATALIVSVSFALMPQAWFEWFGYLSRSKGIPFGPPLWLRLPLAAAVVIWGARTDRRWTVAVAAFLALPNPWWTALAVLGAALASDRLQDRRPAADERDREGGRAGVGRAA